MVGPSTGGSNLHTGPLPLQAENNYGGPQHWRPPNQHTGPLPLQAGNPLLWAPLLEAPKSTHWPPSFAGLKSSYWPLSSAGRNQPGLAPLCRPKSNTIGPTLQAEKQLLLAPLCRPKSTTGGPTLQAENNLLLSQQGHGNTTIYPNRTSMPAILPPAPLQWWPLQ